LRLDSFHSAVVW